MERKTINEIRNILMNELGLSREAIRTEMEKIIYSTMSSHLKTLLDKRNIQKLIREIVEDQFTPKHSYGDNELKKLILSVAKEEIARFINTNISIVKK